MQGRRVAFGRPAAAALRLTVAFALWLELPFFSEDPLDVCPGYVPVERTGYSISHTLWPPGATECEWTTPAGEVRHSTYVPWSEWLILALLGCAAALALPRSPLLIAGAFVVLLGLALVGSWAAILVPPGSVAAGVAWRWGRA
jgi:hypothetical protein